MSQHGFLLALTLAAASSTFAQNGSFTNIDYPGSTFTIPWSINAGASAGAPVKITVQKGAKS